MSSFLGNFLYTPVANDLFTRFSLISNISRCFFIISPSVTPYNEFSAMPEFSERKGRDPVRTCDVDTLVSSIRKDCTVDEAIHSLIRNEACKAITVSHHLIDTLLYRFKDDWGSAMTVFRWAQSRLRGYHGDPGSYEMLVDILGKARQIDEMNVILNEMSKRRLITLKSVAKVMRRTAGARRWDDVLRMFERLEELGLEKNTESMNVLLGVLSKEKMVELAHKIFLDLKKVPIPPNAHTFNILIHGWCNIHKIEEANWTVQEMKNHGYTPCVISYTTIINCYCSLKRFSDAYGLLNEMEVQGCTPNAVTFTAIMSSLADMSEFGEALKVGERMKSAGCKPDVLYYNCIIHILGRAGKLAEAVHVFENEMNKNEVDPNASTYNTMISMFFHHREEDRALQLLKKMTDSGLCKPDLLTYHSYLKFCFMSGKTGDYVASVLDDMVRKHRLCLDFSTYQLLIHGFCRTGDCDSAYCTFEQMIAQGITPKLSTCYLLLDKLKENEKIADANL